jgi:hypothetical protein
MSSNNNTTSLVPILDRTNYSQWAAAMKALIQSTRMWAYVQGKVTREYFSKDEAEYEVLPMIHKAKILTSITGFEKNDGMVLGQIMLRLLPMV